MISPWQNVKVSSYGSTRPFTTPWRSGRPTRCDPPMPRSSSCSAAPSEMRAGCRAVPVRCAAPAARPSTSTPTDRTSSPFPGQFECWPGNGRYGVKHELVRDDGRYYPERTSSGADRRAGDPARYRDTWEWLGPPSWPARCSVPGCRHRSCPSARRDNGTAGQRDGEAGTALTYPPNMTHLQCHDRHREDNEMSQAQRCSGHGRDY